MSYTVLIRFRQSVRTGHRRPGSKTSEKHGPEPVERLRETPLHGIAKTAPRRQEDGDGGESQQETEQGRGGNRVRHDARKLRPGDRERRSGPRLRRTQRIRCR